jgi:hypothetical protein
MLLLHPRHVQWVQILPIVKCLDPQHLHITAALVRHHPPRGADALDQDQDRHVQNSHQPRRIVLDQDRDQDLVRVRGQDQDRPDLDGLNTQNVEDIHENILALVLIDLLRQARESEPDHRRRHLVVVDLHRLHRLVVLAQQVATCQILSVKKRRFDC